METKNKSIRQDSEKRLSIRDVIYALNMAVACLVSYWVTTVPLSEFLDHESNLLGGMWAVVATIFVYRENSPDSLSAGIARFVATCVSFALCLLYLLFLPPTAIGMSILIAAGAVILAALGQRGDILTAGITTAVVMVVAELSPHAAWHQPLLRLVDTIIGIVAGVACKWCSSILLDRAIGAPRPDYK